MRPESRLVRPIFGKQRLVHSNDCVLPRDAARRFLPENRNANIAMGEERRIYCPCVRHMNTKKTIMGRTSFAERLISFLILCTLAAVVTWVVRRGLLHTAPSVERNIPENPAEGAFDALTSATNQAARFLHVYAPSGYQAVGDTEMFSADTAYKKIDGKVEFYRRLGLRALNCQRFTTITQPDDAFSLFVYELADADASYSAWSRQRRENAKIVDIRSAAYATENALFVSHGPFYLELIGESDRESLGVAMQECARRYVEALPTEITPPVEIAWFPQSGLLPDSLMLTLENGFGFEEFRRLFTARYAVSNQEVHAFIAPCATPVQAAQVAASYSEYLVDNGAAFHAEVPGIPGGNVYNVFGTFEVVFTVEAVVGGVHEASDAESALAVAEQLYRSLRERNKKSH